VILAACLFRLLPVLVNCALAWRCWGLRLIEASELKFTLVWWTGMFEFGSVRFRPVEREDLKVLHEWENDFELIMYSRQKPINFVNMAQLEK
jgi:hypothetical protein